MIVDHKLDIAPVPEKVLYINDPELIDTSLLDMYAEGNEENRVRVYVPLDLSPGDILRRLDFLALRYGKANEGNEASFCEDVGQLVRQIEIYDRIMFARTGRHCTQFVKQFVDRLETIPDDCAETFPFDLIDELRRDWDIAE